MPCLIGGALLCYKLLYKSRRFSDLSKALRIFLTSLRFVFLSILCFLLLKPTVEYFKERYEKKIVLVAQDRSASMPSNADSIVAELGRELETVNIENVDVKNVYFSVETSEELIEEKGSLSNFSSIKDYVFQNIGVENIHSLILVSDGIENEGEQVDYALDFGVPVHSFSVGDSNFVKDLKVSEVYSNDLVYANHYFPLEIELSSNTKTSKKLPFQVYQNDTLRLDTLIAFEKGENKVLRTALLADKIDQQRVKLKLGAIDSEKNALNNERELLVETINDVQKVLVLSESSHPDEAFFIEAIKDNPVFEIERKSFQDKVSLEDYNTVMLSGLPKSKKDFTELLKQIDVSRSSVLFIPHNNYRVQWLNDAFDGQVQLRNELNEVKAKEITSFNYFELDKEWPSISSSLSPISVQLGNVSFNTDGSLYEQNIEGIDLGIPLVHFEQAKSSYRALFLGEGYWKWRIQAYSLLNSNDHWKSFVSQTFKYLNTKKNRKKLQLKYQSQYFENDKVKLKALAFNDVYELDPNVELSINLKRQSVSLKSKFNYSKTGYYADLGYLEIGDYEFEVKDESGTIQEEITGAFSIIGNNIELQETRARYDLMSNLTKKTEGLNLNNDLGKLARVINASDSSKPTIYTEKVLESVLKYRFLLILLASLLLLELTIRKIKGVL